MLKMSPYVADSVLREWQVQNCPHLQTLVLTVRKSTPLLHGIYTHLQDFKQDIWPLTDKICDQ